MRSRSGSVWSWNPEMDRGELKEMDRMSRKLLTMYVTIHPRADTDRLYMKRAYMEEED